MKRSLLIWPPLLTVHHLPLGIPSLVAYLKKKKIGDVEVLDLNIAYLKRMRRYWILYMLNKSYQKVARRISPLLKKRDLKNRTIKKAPDGISKKGSTRNTRKDMRARFVKIINRSINRIFDYRKVGNREAESIPWSLESILKLHSDQTHEAAGQKIHRILQPFIKKNDFDLVGISVIYPEQLFFAFIIAKVIKEKLNKDIRVVLGGAQITKHIEQISKNVRLKNFVDFFVTNDGEEPLAELMKELPLKDPADIPNLYFNVGDSGYRRSKAFFQLSPKDILAPNFTGFDLVFYRSRLPVLTSKGCFWSKCNFCTYASMHGLTYCMNTVENTLGNIKTLKDVYGISNYRFVDDAIPPRFMSGLAKGFLEGGFGIQWETSIVLSKDFADRGFCKLLKNSGLTKVSIGLESISSRILGLMNKYHKNLKEDEIKTILVNLKEAGIEVGLHIIFGFPTETIEEARQTLAFLNENRDLYAMPMMQPFCLEDNTPVFNHPEQFGIKKIHKEDKDSGRRLGYRYEVERGMDQEEAKRFTYEEALRAFKR